MRFKEFYEQQQVVGTVEEVEIEGIGRLPARVDTGNTGHNVIHAVNVTPVDKNKVKFATVDNKTLVKNVEGSIDVLAGGKNHDRYVVHFNMRIKDRFYRDIPFSLADRSENEEKVLIGEPFLKKIEAMVDTTKPEVV